MASIYPNRKNGKIVSFKFKVYLGRDGEGKQIFRCTTWTPERIWSEDRMTALAEKEAILWEREAEIAFEKEKNALTPTEITLGDFIEAKWIPNRLNDGEHRSTTVAFRHYMLREIVDFLGEMKMKKIDATEIEDYFHYLKNTYKTSQNKPISAQTMRHHYGTLRLIFDHAVRLGYLEANPVSQIKPPKLDHHKVDSLSKSEVSEFIKAIEELPLTLRLIYTLLLTTGIRRGECFGLKWSDIDMENRILHIERNVTYTPHSGITVGLTKTSTGIRDIPLTGSTIALLNEYRRIEAPASDQIFLFHTPDSPLSPLDPGYITTHMRRFMKRMGLPNMSPHDLRHTCATMLLGSGADIKSVQDILGHADASTTLNFYVGVDMERKMEAAERAFGKRE